MKILLIKGHGAGDPGACANGYVEKDCNLRVIEPLRDMLKSYCDVAVYPVERNAYKDVQNGTFVVNLKDIDYVFEVHFNAGGGTGSEIYVTTRESGIGVEQEIMQNMKKYFKLRDNDAIFDGVKRMNFAVINYCKDWGVSGALLETCFIDNKSDMKIFDDKRLEIAGGICAGIVKGFNLKKEDVPVVKPTTPTKPTKPTTPVEKYEVGQDVQVDALYKTSYGEGKVDKIYKGRITKVFTDGRPKPYLLDEGVGWVGNDDITNAYKQTSKYYPRYVGHSYNIDVVFKSIGVCDDYRGSWQKRTVVAKANKYYSYSGTAAQNDALVGLARKGKLLKPHE